MPGLPTGGIATSGLTMKGGTQCLDFSDIFTAAQAARLWGLDESTVKKACEQKRLIYGEECKKSGRPWIVTRAGMERLYGPQKVT